MGRGRGKLKLCYVTVTMFEHIVTYTNILCNRENSEFSQHNVMKQYPLCMISRFKTQNF